MMLDRRHGVTGDQISSFNPAYRIHNNCDGTGDIEFDFWAARETLYFNDENLDDGCQVEFQVEESCVEDCPSPSWGATKSTDDSPLLPDNHFYSNLSPSRRRQIIEQGRKELMEMVRNMPESNYELSLKDLVDRKNPPEMVKERVVYEDKSLSSGTETKRRKTKTAAGSLSRTKSMEADHFLLKMSFPTRLVSFKKKSMAENSSRVSPSPPEGSEKPASKKRWIKWIFMRRNHNNREDSSNR
ncbi:uncharacterized protein LOC120202514 [Hibiscus syriacus]|nr:uncharacterized protein LOC120202514 [Hibiscus syriacus]